MWLCVFGRQSYDVTVELDVTGTGMKSKSSYDLKNPNFRYMTTPPSVPGTLHTNPTDAYYQDTSPPPHQATATNPYVNNHTAETTATSQYLNPQNLMVSSILSPSTLQSAISTSPQSLLGSSPSLNPAAPQFVPLPEHKLQSSSGNLMNPSAGGFYQSSALYMMGSQQMVYSQCSPSVAGSVAIPNTVTTCNGEKQSHQGILGNPTTVDSLHSRNPYGMATRNHYY